MDLIVSNYRCFSETAPVKIRIADGFTAFLGPNNSGKSAMLKLFYELRSLFTNLDNVARGSAFFTALTGNPSGFGLPPSVGEARSLFCNKNERDAHLIFESLSPEKHVDRGGHTYVFPGKVVLKLLRDQAVCKAEIHYKGAALAIKDSGAGVQREVRTDVNTSAGLEQYISLFADLKNTIYIGPFRNALNIGADQEYFDISVGQAFVHTWDDLKTGPSGRMNELCFQVMRDLEQIFGFEGLEINASPDKKTFQLFINGKTHRLSEIGSGFAHFFITLANVATKSPTYILIDEPELSLHPSLQVKFLTILGRYARKGVMFATHSMGLARSIADRIYTFSLLPDRSSKVAPIEKEAPLSTFLGDLTYSGFAELGFSKLLLVEGPTEIKVVQHFLRLLKKDHSVLVLHLGGTGMINRQRESELAELKRITPNVYALIDSEKKHASDELPASRKGFLELCNGLGIKCEVLKNRATENYFPARAIQAALGGNFSALQPYEKVEDHRPGWGKNQNWLIAKEMNLVEVRDTDIGKFLESL